MNFAITRVACDTAGGTQVITADLGGATPKAALFTVTNCTTDGTPANDLIWCYGFTDGTHEHCLTYFDENGVSPSNTRREGYLRPMHPNNEPVRRYYCRRRAY